MTIYKKIKMTSYGTSGIQKHTMKGSRDISAYKDRMRYPDGKSEVNKYDRKVFEPYPQMDQTQLYDWKYTDKDKPLRMNTEVFRLNSFVNASGKLSPEDSTKAIAKILALSETQMFYMDKKRVMSYFQGRENGKRVESSLVVISKNEYEAKLKQYMADPAVAELGKKYSDPALRAGLTTTTAHENEALSENHIVEPRDPYTLDVKRLRNEYTAVKNKALDFGAPLVRSVLYNIPKP